MKTIFQKLETRLKSLFNYFRLGLYLFQSSQDKELHPILRSYLGEIPLCIFSEPLVWLRMIVRSRSRFKKIEQRPYSFYAPDLNAISFGKSDRISEMLENNWEAIAKEFARVAPEETPTPSKALVKEGTWNTFPLRRSSKQIAENISQCPQTWAIAKQCPLLSGIEGGVYFSIIYPDTHVRPHCGPSNVRYRYHLTIEAAENAKIRSGREWRSWESRKCLILDDSFEHEVQHNGNKRRVVLIVDCWHPDLSEKEREFLSQLHQIWQKPTRKAAEKQLPKFAIPTA